MRDLAATVLALLVLTLPARADEKKVPLGKVPKVVLDGAKKSFPNAEIVGASKETDLGKVAYEVELKVGGKQIDVTITPDGTLTLIEMQIEPADLPLEVVAALAQRYPKSTFKFVEGVITVKDGKGELDYYEALLEVARNKEVEVRVTPDGKIVDEVVNTPKR